MNPAAMTERLIEAAIYSEQASGPYEASSARKELNEARAAIENALSEEQELTQDERVGADIARQIIARVDASLARKSISVRDAAISATAALAAAISLLERTPKSKKAAPSDRMFEQMLCDYRKALDDARAALANTADRGQEEKGNG